MTDKKVEQRRFQRYHADGVEIFARMLSTRKVRLLDLSIAGVSLEVDKRLNIGLDYQIKLECGGKPLSLKGRVIWSCLIKTEDSGRGEVVPIYRAGLQFTDMSPVQTGQLKDFIKTCAIRQEVHKKTGIPASAQIFSKLRCTVRYDIAMLQKEGELLVGSLPQHRVKVIGLGGMLLSCDRPLEEESRYSMELEAPAGGGIKFLGRVVFCKGDEQGGPAYDIGVEFLGLSDDEKAVLSRIISLTQGNLGSKNDNSKF